jgi:sigma-E factor negative regulatory protein RseB
VFIERRSDHQLPSGTTSMGAVNAYIRELNEFSVTAIGEVPAATVKQMAESVLYQKP